MVAEMLTGRALFEGATEQAQIALQLQVVGLPPSELLNNRNHTRLTVDDKMQPHDCCGKRLELGTMTLSEVLGIAIDESALSFIEACLQADPRSRMTAASALQHDFITGGAKPRSSMV